MSEDPQFYRDEITAKFLADIDELVRQTPDLPPDVIQGWKARTLEILEAQFGAGLWGRVERYKLAAFIERLLNRQGTENLDFEALYQAKAQLDRQLFE